MTKEQQAIIQLSIQLTEGTKIMKGMIKETESLIADRDYWKVRAERYESELRITADRAEKAENECFCWLNTNKDLCQDRDRLREVLREISRTYPIQDPAYPSPKIMAAASEGKAP